MKNKNMARVLHLLREGEIDFSEFVSRTRRDYQKMALDLMKRWEAPEWFTLDDMVQELYAGAWHYVWRWEDYPSGATIDAYVSWNARNMAKRALHVARGVTIAGSPDRKKSSFERTFSTFAEEDVKSLMDSLTEEVPRTDDELIQRESRIEAATQALKSCETQYERYTVLAIREGGSLDNAPTVLYEDMDHRIALRLGSEERADRFVYRHAMAVAKRIDEKCVRPV